MDRKKKGKYVGLAGALLVHVVVIALLILVGFTLPEQSEEGGVPVMMGEVPDAWGAADPSLVEVDVMPEETAPEMPEEVEQDMLTQEEEETVAIKPKAEEKKKEAYKRHMEIFNCTPQMTSFIMGLAASMEEQNAGSKEGEFQPESISMIKTSLMGPFAGIGDSFFQGTLRIITFGIGLSFAQQGSILGPILAVALFAIPSLLAAYYGTFLGYRSGNKYLAKLYQEGLMDRVMHFASIVGLAVIGGMVASMVPITTPLQFNTGGTELVLQDMIDQIFPQLLPLVFTLGIYWLIQKKINTNVLLLGIIVFGLVMSAIGIL